MKNLFEYRDYKSYLSAALGGRGHRNGGRSKLSQHLDCQTAHVSQVLNGHTHFSTEQAFKVNSFLGHDREESHFFLLLVQLSRAGTPDLRQYYDQQIHEILERRTLIKNRVSATTTVPAGDQARYYSSWLYAAVHMGLSVPELQTKESLAKYFNLPLAVVAETLEFLMSVGLAESRGGRFVIGPSHVHLGNDADNINKHHTNWRVQALESLDRKDPNDLHYSVVFSLSRADSAKIKDRIIELIKSNLKEVAPSKEEVLFCTGIDFFEIKK